MLDSTHLRYIWCPAQAHFSPMPELPEVEVTRRGLAPQLSGRVISGVAVREPRLRWPVPREVLALAGRTVRTIQRRGKYLLVDCGDGHLILHLGMSGSLRVLPPGNSGRQARPFRSAARRSRAAPARSAALRRGAVDHGRCGRASAACAPRRRTALALPQFAAPVCAHARASHRDQAFPDGLRGASSASATSTRARACSAPASIRASGQEGCPWKTAKSWRPRSSTRCARRSAPAARRCAISSAATARRDTSSSVTGSTTAPGRNAGAAAR